ncbi:MAG: MarR family transcriptional regulator [Burkholderiaceae bacterium]
MAIQSAAKPRATRSVATTGASHAAGKRRSESDPLVDFDLLKDSLGYTLKLAQVRTYEMLFTALGPNAISPARMTALSIIGTQSGINQSALAERLGIARPSVVKVVDTLESLGLIERQSVPNDRRSYALALTQRGKEELREIRGRLRGYEEAITAQLTPRERSQLMALLAKIAVG